MYVGCCDCVNVDCVYARIILLNNDSLIIIELHMYTQLAYVCVRNKSIYNNSCLLNVSFCRRNFEGVEHVPTHVQPDN